MANRGTRKSPLSRMAAKGFRGYPVATIAYYGPDDQTATKVAVGIIPSEDAGLSEMRKWYADEVDIRHHVHITQEIIEYIRQHRAPTVVLAGGILGCPHQEGIDYPEDEACPECPFWAGRDRFLEIPFGE